MESATLNIPIPFNNILYIGDEPKACISVIEKFNARLLEIENSYKKWFAARSVKNRFTRHDRLKYYIHYHFEGGIVMFKFKNEDELPFSIRKECLAACKNIAAEQMLLAL
jgi:hypothetical protein